MRTIKELQEFIGAKADGIWGPKSQAALEAIVLPPVTPAPVPDSGERVDERSEKAISTLHRKVQPLARALVRSAAQEGITIKITSGTRTYAEQNALYEQGRSKPGNIVTGARGGFSSHNFGTAFDVTIFNGSAPVWESPRYRILGKLGQAIGLSWGGEWSKPDEPHFYLKPDWAKSLSESEMMAELRRRHDASIDIFS